MQKKFWKDYTSPMSRMRQAWGFGVHSPFAFRLITKVIREKARYYAYDEIEVICHEHVDDSLSHRQKHLRKRISTSRGRLFFRLTNFFRPDNILEIGTSWGISTLYLRLAGRQSEITVVEPLPEIHDFAESLFADYFRQTPERLYIVVNRLPKPYYRALPDLLAPVLDMHALLIIDGIRSNSEVKSWWEKLVKDERVRVTVDMKNVGLVCCDPKLNKQDYQVSL